MILSINSQSLSWVHFEQKCCFSHHKFSPNCVWMNKNSSLKSMTKFYLSWRIMFDIDRVVKTPLNTVCNFNVCDNIIQL